MDHNFTMAEWSKAAWTIDGRTLSVYDWLQKVSQFVLHFRYSRPPDRLRLRGGMYI